MSKSESESLPPRKTLARLQEMLLKASLLNQPLPGGGPPLRLPDLAFILRHPQIYLSEENLAGEMSVAGLPKPLRVMSQEELRQASLAEGEVAYLHFRPPEADGGGVRLTLEGKFITNAPGQHPVGLSSIQVKFRKNGDEWESTDGPVASAS